MAEKKADEAPSTEHRARSTEPDSGLRAQHLGLPAGREAELPGPGTLAGADLREASQRAAAPGPGAPGIVPPELRGNPKWVEWALAQPNCAADIPKEDLLDRVKAAVGE